MPPGQIYMFWMNFQIIAPLYANEFELMQYIVFVGKRSATAALHFSHILGLKQERIQNQTKNT